MNDETVKNFAEDFLNIEKETSKIIIGQKDIIRNVLIAIVGGGNVLLEGLPGLGKTQLVKALGKTLGLEFSRIQFTPDLMPADVTGTNIVTKDKEGNSSFEFKEGPIFSNIVLADEINRATPKTQSALLEAMQEKTVTVGTKTFILPEPFFVLATQNPVEQEGTYPLPEAQMDRFMFKLNVEYPSRDELLKIVTLTTGSNKEDINISAGKEKIIEMRKIAMEVPVASSVYDYIIDFVMKCHPEVENAPDIVKKYVRYGSSPRGAQAIVTASRIQALINGRYNVSYEDVNSVIKPALRHRLYLNFEAIADGVSADDIIDNIAQEGM
ncbi:AAA family ATPase [Tyzzerella sp. An114]|uniref:AAA family ATPase n=1 Tax=Tyzzerella sp. An114 TaxID=1965545 RepID=UPI000B43C759|nr:MoxR family ATPase [Tyzzerella sp. An114]OUQ58371.1 AAA family ATPase [Tyzzerella sp. An114]